MERVTLEDVARAADVSPATVSRVVNDPSRVRTETREVVYRAMRQLGYTPPAARPADDSRINSIALFTPDPLLDSVIELVRAIEYELRETDVDLLLVSMHGERDVARFVSKHATLRKKMDAAIVFSAHIDQHAAAYFRSIDVPVVLMQARSTLVRSVSNNNFLGGHDATRYLIRCGYREIAFVGWQPSDDHIENRLAGYRSALEKAGLLCRPEHVVFGSLSPDGGLSATRELLQRQRPDAIFYAADIMAIGGMQEIHRLGLSIPQQIGVMGFDDLRIAGILGLTTMKQFFSTKARMVVQYLLDRVHGVIREDHIEELQVTPRVVARETTRTPPEETADDEGELNQVQGELGEDIIKGEIS